MLCAKIVFITYLPALVTIISVPSSLNSSHKCFISNAAPTPESFGCSWLLATVSNRFLSDDRYDWWEVDLMACIFELDTVSKHAVGKWYFKLLISYNYKKIVFIFTLKLLTLYFNYEKKNTAAVFENILQRFFFQTSWHNFTIKIIFIWI